MSDLQQFYTTQPRTGRLLTAVEIKHPAINTVRLAKDQFHDQTLLVDGVNQTFKGASFVVPEQSILFTDETEKGNLSFNRIGFEVLNELRKTDNYSGFESMVVRVFQYLDGISTPVSDYSVFAEEVNLDARNVTITLTTENFEKQSKADQIFTADEFPGIAS